MIFNSSYQQLPAAEDPTVPLPRGSRVQQQPREDDIFPAGQLQQPDKSWVPGSNRNLCIRTSNVARGLHQGIRHTWATPENAALAKAATALTHGVLLPRPSSPRGDAIEAILFADSVVSHMSPPAPGPCLPPAAGARAAAAAAARWHPAALPAGISINRLQVAAQPLQRQPLQEMACQFSPTTATACNNAAAAAAAEGLPGNAAPHPLPKAASPPALKQLQQQKDQKEKCLPMHRQGAAAADATRLADQHQTQLQMELVLDAAAAPYDPLAGSPNAGCVDLAAALPSSPQAPSAAVIKASQHKRPRRQSPTLAVRAGGLKITSTTKRHRAAARRAALAAAAAVGPAGFNDVDGNSSDSSSSSTFSRRESPRGADASCHVPAVGARRVSYHGVQRLASGNHRAQISMGSGKMLQLGTFIKAVDAARKFNQFARFKNALAPPHEQHHINHNLGDEPPQGTTPVLDNLDKTMADAVQLWLRAGRQHRVDSCEDQHSGLVTFTVKPGQ